MKIYQLVLLAALSGLTINPEKHNYVLDLMAKQLTNFNKCYYIAYTTNFTELEKFWSLMTISEGMEVKQKLCLTDFFYNLVK